MPRSIDLSEELKDKVIISPLDKIHSLHELIEKINKEPELLQKVTDHELQFFGIQTDKAMELRKIAGEKKQKRDKGLKEFIQNIIDANKEKEEKDTQSGGAATDINPNKVKRDLALYACMLI